MFSFIIDNELYVPSFLLLLPGGFIGILKVWRISSVPITFNHLQMVCQSIAGFLPFQTGVFTSFALMVLNFALVYYVVWIKASLKGIFASKTVAR